MFLWDPRAVAGTVPTFAPNIACRHRPRLTDASPTVLQAVRELGRTGDRARRQGRLERLVMSG